MNNSIRTSIAPYSRFPLSPPKCLNGSNPNNKHVRWTVWFCLLARPLPGSTTCRIGIIILSGNNRKSPTHTPHHYCYSSSACVYVMIRISIYGLCYTTLWRPPLLFRHRGYGGFRRRFLLRFLPEKNNFAYPNDDSLTLWGLILQGGSAGPKTNDNLKTT